MTHVDSNQSYAMVAPEGVSISGTRVNGIFFDTSLDPRERRILLFPHVGEWVTLPVAAQICSRPRPVSVPAGTKFRLAEKGNPASRSCWEVA